MTGATQKKAEASTPTASAGVPTERTDGDSTVKKPLTHLCRHTQFLAKLRLVRILILGVFPRHFT